MKQNHLNYYYWLTDEEYGKECKEKLIVIYDNYYVTTDKKEKEELSKNFEDLSKEYEEYLKKISK